MVGITDHVTGTNKTRTSSNCQKKTKNLVQRIIQSTNVHVLKVWKQTTTVTTFEHLVTLSAHHDTTTPPSSNTTIVHIQCQVALVVSMVSCYIFSLSCLHISDVFFCFYLSLPAFHGTFSHPPRLTPSPDSNTTQK